MEGLVFSMFLMLLCRQDHVEQSLCLVCSESNAFVTCRRPCKAVHLISSMPLMVFFSHGRQSKAEILLFSMLLVLLLFIGKQCKVEWRIFVMVLVILFLMKGFVFAGRQCEIAQ